MSKSKKPESSKRVEKNEKIERTEKAVISPKPDQSARKKLFEACRQKLISAKTNHLNVLRSLTGELVAESQGDVADQARALQEETMSLARRGKLVHELSEIEQALDRIKSNNYGICEETGNIIEDKRLEAIPWTRLSLEGAEIREMERQELEEEAASAEQN
jgi:DnaK suppressor protein